MSLWTPGGEHPVDRGGPATAADQERTSDEQAAPAGTDGPPLSAEQKADAEALASEMAEVREQLASVPAAVVVANHAMGLYELAAIHLSHQPPNSAEARVAIDAFAALVEAVKGRLGPDEPVLTDALNQIRLAFVQVTSSGTEGSEGDSGARE